MKHSLIAALSIVSIFLFCWCIVFPAIYCSTFTNYSFWELNFPKKDPSYKLPNGDTLLFNRKTSEYEIKLKSEIDKRLRVYSQFGARCEIWSDSELDKVTKFKDSSIAKFYDHLWHQEQESHFLPDGFKKLTK